VLAARPFFQSLRLLSGLLRRSPSGQRGQQTEAPAGRHLSALTRLLRVEVQRAALGPAPELRRLLAKLVAVITELQAARSTSQKPVVDRLRLVRAALRLPMERVAGAAEAETA